MPLRAWKSVRRDPPSPGIGPLLLRAGSGPNDSAYVGFQEVHPTHWCFIPSFDAEEAT